MRGFSLEPFARLLELSVWTMTPTRSMSDYRKLFELPAPKGGVNLPGAISGRSMGKVSHTGRLPTPLQMRELPARNTGSAKDLLPVMVGIDPGAPEGDRGIVVMKHRPKAEGQPEVFVADWSEFETRMAALAAEDRTFGSRPPPPLKPKGDVFTRITAQNLRKAYAAVTRGERGEAKARWSMLLYTENGEETLKALHGANIMSDDWEDRYA